MSLKLAGSPVLAMVLAISAVAVATPSFSVVPPDTSGASGVGSGSGSGSGVAPYSYPAPAKDSFECGNIASAGAKVLTKCEVANIRWIRQDWRLGQGPRAFCTSDCGVAVEELAESAQLCTDAELDAVFGAGARGAIVGARREQTKCAPPSIECMVTFRNFERWEKSVVGQTCLQHAKLLLALPDTSSAAVLVNGKVSQAQARSAAFCESDACGGSVMKYLELLEEQNCERWEAYRTKRAQYDEVCYKATFTTPPATAATSVYCNSIFTMDKFRGDMRRVSNDVIPDSVNGTTSDATLDKICTPCYYEYVRSHSRFARATSIGRLEAMDKLCLRDSGKYCYPRYRKAVQATDTLGETQKAEKLCDQPVMGYCASLMQMRDGEAEFVNTNRCLRRVLNVKDKTLLNARYSNKNDAFCASLMTQLVGNYTVDGVYVGPTYTSPSKCNKLAKKGDVCSWGCQNAFTPIRDTLGCCYETTKQYFADLGYKDIPGVFSNTDLVMADCNRPADPKCDVFRYWPASEAEFVINVPYHYARMHSVSTDPLHTAVALDLQRATGVSSSGLVIVRFAARSAASTTVHFRVLDQGNAQAKERVAAYAARAAAGQTSSLNADRLYFNTAEFRDWTSRSKSNYYAEF